MPQTMESRLLTPLNALEASLNSLLHTLTTSNTFTSGPRAATDLITADTDLDAALTLLSTHQRNHADLVRLRAEKDALQARLKDTVFEAWRLRTELGNIHTSILDDSDAESVDDEQATNPIDYQTLMSFALRIGKHNAIAAQEAERASEQKYLEARRKREEDAKVQMNGAHAEDLPPPTAAATAAAVAEPAEASQSQSQSQTQQTQEVLNNMSEIRNIAISERAVKTAPFPNAEILRRGALGRLQLVREQYGEDDMDAEAEKLVRESEMKGQKGAEAATPVQREKTVQETSEATPVSQQQQPIQRPQQPVEARPAVPAQQPKKKIDLDFPGDDDDDDDDD